MVIKNYYKLRRSLMEVKGSHYERFEEEEDTLERSRQRNKDDFDIEATYIS